jgi:hypothetical protein
MNMKKKITTMIALGLFAGSTAFADTTILTNTEFNGFDGWIAGSNVFLGGVWQAFATAPDAYSFEDRVQASGDGFVFQSWDDGESDKLENYLFQEFGAGPASGTTPNEIFTIGDTIVFKGKASATRAGTDPSDMIVRAFIKFLGYNELGWEFQTKEADSKFFPITADLQEFELVATFPDIVADDSYQVVQLGFEITNEFDGAAMDSGTIYFQDIEGFIVGGDTPTWASYAVDENGWANTEGWLGWVNTAQAPWIQILAIDNYGYVEESGVTDSGAWIYVLGK